MKLDGPSYTALFGALDDAFQTVDDLRPVARLGIGPELQDIVALPAKKPVAVDALIAEAERRDKITDLVLTAQQLNKDNKLLKAIDPATLVAAKTDAEVVAEGEGSDSFKDKLKAALTDLDDEHMQLVAAEELNQLLVDASEGEAAILYLAMLGHVKAEMPDAIVAALTPVFLRALRRRVGAVTPRPDEVVIDLVGVKLRRPDLSHLDLHGADIAFANLAHANFDGSDLRRCRGYGVDLSEAGLSRSTLVEIRWHHCTAREARFHDTTMTSAFLKDADLTGAEFQLARLQGAHFDRAKLAGARFEQANLADATFTGAEIDEAAAGSISRAVRWRDARFDAPVRAMIEAAVA